jgi:hypothetical protein
MRRYLSWLVIASLGAVLAIGFGRLTHAESTATQPAPKKLPALDLLIVSELHARFQDTCRRTGIHVGYAGVLAADMPRKRAGEPPVAEAYTFQWNVYYRDARAEASVGNVLFRFEIATEDPGDAITKTDVDGRTIYVSLAKYLKRNDTGAYQRPDDAVGQFAKDLPPAVAGLTPRQVIKELFEVRP